MLTTHLSVSATTNPDQKTTSRLEYLHKEMGVKTDRNGFLTEDGLVAFYRGFGRLGGDIEAAGVRYSMRGGRDARVVLCWAGLGWVGLV